MSWRDVQMLQTGSAVGRSKNAAHDAPGRESRLASQLTYQLQTHANGASPGNRRGTA
jgi:hypothetical protein